MKISLTFDNGPDLEVTPGVLDTLGKYNVKATFFLLGKNIAAPERRLLAGRAFNEGHRLGNHSYSHSVPFGLLDDPTEAVSEILATDALLGELAGRERLFRPFGRARIGRHLLNDAAWETLVANQFTCVLWTCIPPERDRPDSWMEPAIRMCETRPWSVIVLHDLPTGAMRKLDSFLAMLTERGAEFSQDFPVECTPLRKGVAVGPHEHLMASADSSNES
jgi:peptidoglycan/xylan/chitin deacetylase (PgdA/CDA1 family)